jgi:hypothetical protein
MQSWAHKLASFEYITGTSKADSVQFWRGCTAVYQTFSTLWKVNSEEYKNKKLKQESYDVFLDGECRIVNWKNIYSL